MIGDYLMMISRASLLQYLTATMIGLLPWPLFVFTCTSLCLSRSKMAPGMLNLQAVWRADRPNLLVRLTWTPVFSSRCCHTWGWLYLKRKKRNHNRYRNIELLLLILDVNAKSDHHIIKSICKYFHITLKIELIWSTSYGDLQVYYLGRCRLTHVLCLLFVLYWILILHLHTWLPFWVPNLPEHSHPHWVLKPPSQFQDHHFYRQLKMCPRATMPWSSKVFVKATETRHSWHNNPGFYIVTM